MNNLLLPYGFRRGEIIEAPCTFVFALVPLEDISKRAEKLASFTYCQYMKQPLPTYGRNFVRRKTSFAVLPHGHFNLIVRETLRKNLGDCLEWKSYQIVIF